MSNYIINGSFNRFSNVYTLEFKCEYCSYGSSSVGVKAADRLRNSGSVLKEGEFLGLQLSYGSDNTYSGCVFTSPDVEASPDDFNWILDNFAGISTSDTAKLCDFAKNRKVYAFRQVTDGSDPENHHGDQKRITFDDIDKHRDITEMTRMLIANDVILRIVAGSDREYPTGWWTILISAPNEISLRMRSALSYVFPDMELTELKPDYGEEDMNFRIRDALLYGEIGDIFNCLMFKIEDICRQEQRYDEEDYLSPDDFEDFEEDIIDEADDQALNNGSNIPIEDLELSVRSYNCLKRAGIKNLCELKALTDDEFRHIRNLGKKSFEEIRAKLSEYDDLEENRINKIAAKDYRAELDALVGLKNVKEQIKKIQAYARMNKDLVEQGKNSIPLVLNMEFVGNPGTAKTTVARIVAGIFKEIGILSGDEIIEVGRADLIAKFEGQTAGKVKEVFRNARGKLLFIDEAYSLADHWDGDFADEAISTIVQEMENNRDNTIVVFAGYPDKMADFFSRNPGLRSRVPFHIVFEDYSADEMVEIAQIEASKRGFTIDAAAAEKLYDICKTTIGNRDAGNGRFCRNIVEDAVLNYAERVYGACEVDNNIDFSIQDIDLNMPIVQLLNKPVNPIGFRDDG